MTLTATEPETYNDSPPRQPWKERLGKAWDEHDVTILFSGLGVCVLGGLSFLPTAFVAAVYQDEDWRAAQKLAHVFSSVNSTKEDRAYAATAARDRIESASQTCEVWYVGTSACDMPITKMILRSADPEVK